jgi:hypothetical protein
MTGPVGFWLRGDKEQGPPTRISGTVEVSRAAETADTALRPLTCSFYEKGLVVKGQRGGPWFFSPVIAPCITLLFALTQQRRSARCKLVSGSRSPCLVLPTQQRSQWIRSSLAVTRDESSGRVEFVRA